MIWYKPEFNSIKSIKDGWDFKFSENGLKYFNTAVKFIKIGILGNQQVGKSFILPRLFDSTYSQNTIYNSEKICIKLKQKKAKFNLWFLIHKALIILFQMNKKTMIKSI